MDTDCVCFLRMVSCHSGLKNVSGFDRVKQFHGLKRSGLNRFSPIRSLRGPRSARAHEFLETKDSCSKMRPLECAEKQGPRLLSDRPPLIRSGNSRLTPPWFPRCEDTVRCLQTGPDETGQHWVNLADARKKRTQNCAQGSKEHYWWRPPKSAVFGPKRLCNSCTSWLAPKCGMNFVPSNSRGFDGGGRSWHVQQPSYCWRTSVSSAGLTPSPSKVVRCTTSAISEMQLVCQWSGAFSDSSLISSPPLCPSVRRGARRALFLRY